MEYVLISGIVTELNITKGYEDLAFTGRSKNLVGMASIAAAVMGNGTSSTILASSSNGAEVQMEFFTCRVNNLRLFGRFYKVEFRDGENIDFVVTKNGDLNEVHSARNPIERLIWSTPYRTRGHRAQKKHDISSSLKISAVSSLLFSVLMYSQQSRPWAECWRTVLYFSPVSFSIILIVNCLSRWPFYKFSYEATKVFKAFGFADPPMVNLEKNHGLAEKEYYEQIGAPRPWRVIPLRYRYMKNALRLKPSEVTKDLTVE
jgi:hypothetical protein